MGSILGSNATNTTSDLTRQHVSKGIQELSCKLKLKLIVNCWLRQVKITLFPIDIKQIIIDNYTYQYEFDNPHYYPASKSDTHGYYTIKRPKTCAKEYDYLFKIFSIGNPGVGKTALQERFTDDSFGEAGVQELVDFRMRTINCDGKTIKLQIWDPVLYTCSYYKTVNAIILCYDLTNEETLNDIKQWDEDCVTYGKKHVVRIMVGTKCDLEREIKCTKEDAIKIAKECDIDYIIETSAKKNINIEKTFHDITQQILNIVEKRTKYPFIH
eukprot:527086_1